MPETTEYKTPAAGGAQDRLRRFATLAGGFVLEAFHLIALFAIGGATILAAGHAFIGMMGKPSATSIEDLLLLFIYLEIGAMVGIYFKTNHMPVRFLIYVAITALTRHLVGYVNTNHKPDLALVVMTGSILILAAAVLVLRYASSHFPSPPGGEGDEAKGGARH